MGWGNYPDSISGVTVDTLKFLKVGSAVLQWTDPSSWNPSPSTDPVLFKNSQSSFNSALARAQSSARLGLYQSAQTDYSLAVTEAFTPTELLECLHSWRQMVVATERDSAHALAGIRNTYWTSMCTSLANNAAYADSAWKRNISNEILSVELVRKRDTTEALNVLSKLMSYGMTEEYRRRALLRSIYTYYCLMKDYQSAMNHYLEIAHAFPGSLEQFEAKLILRLPIDSADAASVQKAPAARYIHERPTVAHRGWITIEGPRPNPTASATTFIVTTARAVWLRIDFYDLAAKSLLTVYNGLLVIGTHRISFDGARLRPGVYLSRVTGYDEESNTPFSFGGKFVVVR